MGQYVKYETELEGIWFETHLSPIIEEDEVKGLMGTGIDITHLKKIEDELRKAKENTENINQTLEQRVKDRTGELAILHNELIEQSHQAGMAQLATNVLHNVGNLLNSMDLSLNELMEQTTKKSIIHKFLQGNKLIKANIDQFETFVLNDPRGKQLFEYFLALEPEILREHNNIEHTTIQLKNSMQAILDIIISQNHIASGPMLYESIDLKQLIPEVINIMNTGFLKNKIKVTLDLKPVDHIHGQRSKLVYLLNNLLKNAQESMRPNEAYKEISIQLKQKDKDILLFISDNGSGINVRNLTRVFEHGFTTKKIGHGFGLHSCANYMAEMKGTIKVHSDGEEKGTQFILNFPAINQDSDHIQIRTKSV